MHGRMYDPVLGQFLSPDPVMQMPFSQGFNRFAYTFNNPLSYVDPSGFEASPTTIGIDVGIGAAYGTGLALTLAGGSSVGAGAGVSAGVGAAAVGTGAGVANALGAGTGAASGIAVVANIALLTSLQPVHTAAQNVDVASRAANMNGQGTPTMGRTSAALGTSPVTEGLPTRARAGSGANGQSARDPQGRVTREYNDLGLNYGRNPRYDATELNYGATGSDGVRIGPLAANGTRSVLRSTLLHEGAHVRQIGQHNYAKAGIPAGNVNELEAYQQELLNVDRSGLSEAEQQRVAADYYKKLDNLFNEGPVGDYYLRRVLIENDFTLRGQDTTNARIPDWVPSP